MLAAAERLAPPVTTPWIDAACARLGRDLRAWDALPAASAFATNRDVQVGVFVANHLHLMAFQSVAGPAVASAGMSLGEYNHLVHIGAIDFLDALAVVDQRGRAYDAGPRGCMAAVFPVTPDEVEEVLRRSHGFVAISNRNSPRQQVIAGEVDAVRAAMALLEEEQWATATVIEPHIPMHTARFAPAAQALEPALRAAPWCSPQRPYVPNVLGRTLLDPTPDDIVQHLLRHVSEPVRWQTTVEHLHAEHPHATFVEVGPASVLHDLMRVSWLRVRRAHTRDAAAFAEAVELARA